MGDIQMSLLLDPSNTEHFPQSATEPSEPVQQNGSFVKEARSLCDSAVAKVLGFISEFLQSTKKLDAKKKRKFQDEFAAVKKKINACLLNDRNNITFWLAKCKEATNEECRQRHCRNYIIERNDTLKELERALKALGDQVRALMKHDRELEKKFRGYAVGLGLASAVGAVVGGLIVTHLFIVPLAGALAAVLLGVGATAMAALGFCADGVRQIKQMRSQTKELVESANSWGTRVSELFVELFVDRKEASRQQLESLTADLDANILPYFTPLWFSSSQEASEKLESLKIRSVELII